MSEEHGSLKEDEKSEDEKSEENLEGRTSAATRPGGLQEILSNSSVVLGTFSAAISIASLFTRNALEALAAAGIALLFGLLAIVVTYRNREILSRRLRVPAYLLLAGVIVMPAAGFLGRGLWLTLSAPRPPATSPSSNVSGSAQPRSSPIPSNSSGSSPALSSPPASLSAPGGDSVASPAVFSLDGELVAGAGNSESTDVYAWDARTGKYIGTLPLASDTSLEALAFSPDDKSLLVLDAAGGVCRWNLSSTSCSRVLADPGWYTGGPWNSAISGDTGTVAYQDRAGTGVDVLSVATRKQIGHFTDPSSTPLTGANYSGNNVPGSAVSLDEDGRVLTVGDARGNLYVWDVAANQLLATLHFSPAAVLGDGAPAAILSPNGQTVLVPSPGNSPRPTLWNILTKVNVTPADTRWPRTWPNGTFNAFFTGDGGGIVTYRDDRSGADLWDTPTNVPIASIPFSGRFSIMGLEVYAASSQEILTGDGGSKTFLWRISRLLFS